MVFQRQLSAWEVHRSWQSRPVDQERRRKSLDMSRPEVRHFSQFPMIRGAYRSPRLVE